MPEYTFVSLETWPGEKTRVRQSSPFRATWSQTVTLLDRELNFLCAKNVVIQADCDRSEIRLDGFLRPGARLRGPGVILTFDSKHGPLSYPCDRYSDYQSNVRAIALSLEALRAVDRYGVTRRAEQYKGWEKLAPPPSSFGSVRSAASFISSLIGRDATDSIVNDSATFRAMYRAAAGASHPDANGGFDEAFRQLQAAKEVLEKHHGL